jgi:hypothetical protein
MRLGLLCMAPVFVAGLATLNFANCFVDQPFGAGIFF